MEKDNISISKELEAELQRRYENFKNNPKTGIFLEDLKKNKTKIISEISLKLNKKGELETTLLGNLEDFRNMTNILLENDNFKIKHFFTVLSTIVEAYKEHNEKTKLSKSALLSIEKGLQDAEKGNFVTSEEVHKGAKKIINFAKK